jgi:hypothetical protein
MPDTMQDAPAVVTMPRPALDALLRHLDRTTGAHAPYTETLERIDMDDAVHALRSAA